MTISLETDDDALVSAFLAGDSDAFRILLSRHAPSLHRLAFRLTQSREDAEDLVQETFVRVLEGLRRYRPSGKFPAWLRTILVRLALDRARRSPPTPGRLEPVDAGPGPEESAVIRDAARRLRQELGRLPAGYRAVVVLLNGEGLSVREVSETLGLPASVVKNRAMRARRMLRAALSDGAQEVSGDGQSARREQAHGFIG